MTDDPITANPLANMLIHVLRNRAPRSSALAPGRLKARQQRQREEFQARSDARAAERARKAKEPAS